MTAKPARNLFTIPAGVPFARTIAAGLLARTGGAPDALAGITLLLPTRRAARTVREAFLRLENGKPLILPRLQTLGDVEEESLSFHLAGQGAALDIPPSLSPLRRQIMLTRLIGGMADFTRGPAADMALAEALGQLMDQVYTEDRDLSALPALVDGTDFAQHWQITLNFLSLLSEHWPHILAEEGKIDAADRRNRLIKALCAAWEKTPPAGPVIAAGSTGSIPATARLLGVVTSLPQGEVILPGLDTEMGDREWDTLDDTHPQTTLKSLLQHLECDRHAVKIWPAATGKNNVAESRRALAAEIMRPAETTDEWRTLPLRTGAFGEALTHIHRYDCASPQAEAQLIAVLLRETLEKGDSVAALITPDRTLARRVAMACRRWGIEIDDSAGQKLPDTAVGGYLRLAMQAVQESMAPVSLLAFLKSALTGPEVYKGDWRADIRRLDQLLRGPAPRRGLGPLLQKSETVPLLKSFLEDSFTPALALASQGPAPFAAWLEVHLSLAEAFCPPGRLWSSEDGEQAATFFAALRDEAADLPAVSAADFAVLLDTLMGGITVRPAYGRHPRLMILGQLEARLIEADRVILAGLNEGTWPPAPAADPWMSRPMRKRFGLPAPDRGIGLAAHDFVQGFCAPDVILTRSQRENGTPTVPARWLLRMETVLKSLGMALPPGPHEEWAAHLDDVSEVKAVQRPEPRPPVESRPRRLSVTRIEPWLTDPYSIYAQYVLRVEKLPPLEEPVDTRVKGILLHKMMDKFVKTYPKSLPEDIQGAFLTIAAKELTDFSDDPALWSFWKPRLARIGDWIATQEADWRQTWTFRASEAKGTTERPGPAGPFTLSAHADRIDTSADGRTAAIIDYKSGGKFSLSGMANGKHPQLPLEALILAEGGFENIPPMETAALAYWILRGGSTPDRPTVLEKDIVQAVDNARAGLDAMIATFDREDTPYYSYPDPSRRGRFGDYDHLARVKEWSAIGESDDSGEEAA